MKSVVVLFDMVMQNFRPRYLRPLAYLELQLGYECLVSLRNTIVLKTLSETDELGNIVLFMKRLNLFLMKPALLFQGYFFGIPQENNCLRQGMCEPAVSFL